MSVCQQQLPKYWSSSVCSNLAESCPLQEIDGLTSPGVLLATALGPAPPPPYESGNRGRAEGPPAGGAQGVGRGGRGPGAGRAPQPGCSEGAVSVRLAEREEVLGPRGARAKRPAQRETAHPARAGPAALRSGSSLDPQHPPGAAAAPAPGAQFRRRRRARPGKQKGGGVALARPPLPRPSSTLPAPSRLRVQPGTSSGRRSRSRTLASPPAPGSWVLRCALRWPETPSGSPLLQLPG